MMRRALAAALLVLGTALVLVAPDAGAARVTDAAWWSRAATNDPLSESPQALPVPNPTLPAPAPVGATVPEGQLLVEGTPEGAMAVAGLRFELSENESGPSLVLPVAPGSTVSPTSVVLACRAGAPWERPETLPGRWESKPVVDNRACINGVIADDVSTVGFGLQPLLSKNVLDVIIVPGLAVEAPADAPVKVEGSSFRLLFEEPTAESLETVDRPFVPGSDVPTVTTQPPPSDGGDAGAGSGPTSDGGAVPRVSAPAASITPPAARHGDSSAAASPALEPDEVAAPIDDFGVAQQVPIVDSSAGAAARNVGLILLLAGAVAAAWAYLSDPGADASAVGLGRFRRELVPAGATVTMPAGGEPADGGLGRFRGPRSSPPVSIQ